MGSFSWTRCLELQPSISFVLGLDFFSFSPLFFLDLCNDTKKGRVEAIRPTPHSLRYGTVFSLQLPALQRMLSVIYLEYRRVPVRSQQTSS